MDTNKLYDELIQEFPELAEHPEATKHIIETFVKTHPDHTPTQEFKEQLRQSLQSYMHTAHKQSFPWSTLFGGLLSGAALATIGFVLLPSLTQPTSTLPQEDGTSMKITQEEQEADALILEDSETTTMSEPAAISSRSMLVPEAPLFRGPYTTSEELPEIPRELATYQGEKSSYINGESLSNISDSVPFNPSLFTNVQPTNSSYKVTLDNNTYYFSLNDEFGNISLSLDQGYVLRTLETVRPMEPKEIPMPTDEKLIGAADSFLQSIAMDKSALGSPQVNKQFLENADSITYPGQLIPVLYPFEINGIQFHDQWGNLVGVQVQVRADDLAVTDMFIPRTPSVNNTVSTFPVEKIQGLFRPTDNKETPVTLTNLRIEYWATNNDNGDTRQPVYHPKLIGDTPEGQSVALDITAQ